MKRGSRLYEARAMILLSARNNHSKCARRNYSRKRAP
eukprot:UN07484